MNQLLGNLDELVAQVRRRTEQRALGVTATAEAQAERLAAKGRARADAIRAAAAEHGVAMRVELDRRRRAVADLARRRRRLEAREAHLELVWRMAAERLIGPTASPVPLDALAGLARDGARRLGADEATVCADANTLARLDAAVVAAWSPPEGPRLILDPTPHASGHGLVVRAGRVSVDATLEGRLDQARERLRDEIASLLADREPVGTT